MKGRGAELFAIAVGLGDAGTGAALVAAPATTARALGCASAPGEAETFLRWIGAFVLAVGCAYLLPYVARGPERAARLRGAVAWTAFARLVVAAFVSAAIAARSLDASWAGVAGYDAAVAVVQIVLLARGAFGRGRMDPSGEDLA